MSAPPAPGPASSPPAGDAAPGADGAYDAARATLGWQLARRAVALALADPMGLGGVVLHGQHGPARDALLAELSRRAPARRIPSDADDAALVGGLDPSATLAEGRPVHRPGLLDGPPDRPLILGGAERLAASVAARLGAWLEHPPARGGRAPLIVLDERVTAPGSDAPELVGSALGERLALHVAVPVLALAELRTVADPDGHAPADGGAPDTDAAAPTAPGLGRQAVGPGAPASPARGTPADVVLSDERLDAVVRLAARLGIDSLRAPAFACRAARANAWLDGREAVSDDDAALAVQLVLAPRARTPPDAPDEPEPAEDPDEAPPADDAPDDEPRDAADDTPEPETAEPPESPGPDAKDPPDPKGDPVEDTTDDELADTPLAERLVDAVTAALPRNLLDALAAGRAADGAGAGRDAGASAAAERHGRPIGTRRPRGGTGRRPNLLATLTAAIPHQRLRAVDAVGPDAVAAALARGERLPLRVRRDDFRVTRYRRPTRTTTVFVVDASGSAAMHRLAEAKGAVEGLLAECYVRRDRVALITFRGTEATLDLPPTRSLVRARRALAGLPGGGGTPLAAGFDLAATELERLARDGESPVGVFMTDGRGNVARDGGGSRPRARTDAERAARRLARSGARLLFVDTGPRPRPEPRALAAAMGARYVPLPELDVARLARGSAA